MRKNKPFKIIKKKVESNQYEVPLVQQKYQYPVKIYDPPLESKVRKQKKEESPDLLIKGDKSELRLAAARKLLQLAQPQLPMYVGPRSALENYNKTKLKIG